jgi:hypothetical protein
MTICIDINEVLRDYLRAFAKQYNKVVDPYFDIEYDDINDFNLMNVFPFLDEDGNQNPSAFNSFRFEDSAFEIYSRADVMERDLAANLNLWINGTLRNFDEDKNPTVILFSPLEMNLSIPSTLGFLARIGMRFRNIEFPIDSTKMWDKADIMITANPKLLALTPEGKYSFKVNAPYNKDVKGTFEYDSLVEIIKDENKTIEKIIEGDDVLSN